MKIQCDSCGVAVATVVCCADEAALCARCDVDIHAANKLATKHQRLPLDALGAKLPHCDICQEKAAFIFCAEDRALFCRDCDEPIHVPGMLSGNHQRYLATGIRVGLGPVSACAAGDHGTSHDADHHAPPKAACEPQPPAQRAARPIAAAVPAAGLGRRRAPAVLGLRVKRQAAQGLASRLQGAGVVHRGHGALPRHSN